MIIPFIYHHIAILLHYTFISSSINIFFHLKSWFNSLKVMKLIPLSGEFHIFERWYILLVMRIWAQPHLNLRFTSVIILIYDLAQDSQPLCLSFLICEVGMIIMVLIELLWRISDRITTWLLAIYVIFFVTFASERNGEKK